MILQFCTNEKKGVADYNPEVVKKGCQPFRYLISSLVCMCFVEIHVMSLCRMTLIL